MSSNLIAMNKQTLEAALTAGAKELKNQTAAKAKRIDIGTDAHLRGYQAARKIDNGPIGASGKLPEPGRAVALRGEANGTSRGSGSGLRSRAIELQALSSA